jgi:hypothetical protein
MFSGVRPFSGAAGLGAGETWQSSGVFGVETLLLPRTAALRTLNRYQRRRGPGKGGHYFIECPSPRSFLAGRGTKLLVLVSTLLLQ